MKQEDIQAIQQLLSTPKKIAIIPHRSPDGDAMGSTLGLYHFLLKLNHEPIVIAPNEFPEFLAWLPGSEKVLIFEKKQRNYHQNTARSRNRFYSRFQRFASCGRNGKHLEYIESAFYYD